jgi:hypothetical protein
LTLNVKQNSRILGYLSAAMMKKLQHHPGVNSVRTIRDTRTSVVEAIDRADHDSIRFNSNQFLFICVPTQQPKGQLQNEQG